MRIYDTHYVKFKKGDQKRLLKLVKEWKFSSWDKFAETLGVGRSMIFLYLKEKCKLPKKSFDKIVKISNVNLANFSYEIAPYMKQGEAKIPKKLDSELAEFIGIMLGDGNIYRRNYQITITSGVIDGNYILDYIPKLMTSSPP